MECEEADFEIWLMRAKLATYYPVHEENHQTVRIMSDHAQLILDCVRLANEAVTRHRVSVARLVSLPYSQSSV